MTFIVIPMKHVHQHNEPTRDQLACSLLKAEGICPLDAAHILIDLVHSCREKNRITMPRIRRIVRIAAEACRKEEYSVTFEHAVKKTLDVKAHRRKRTLQEISSIARTLMRRCPGLRYRKIRSISSNDCRNYLYKAFSSERQRHKARLIMSGIFTIACNRGWCAENPIRKVESPALREHEIKALSTEQINRLLHTASRQQYLECLPMIGLMLYAGVRPYEATRLSWGDICMDEKVISIKPCHSKTGGARHVSIMPPLEKILRHFSHGKQADDRISPKCWQRKWKELRKDAGWDSPDKPWVQDCLRHTFASYHAKYFRDYQRLQWEMGHHSSALLRTRYLNMNGVTRQNAETFWRESAVALLC